MRNAVLALALAAFAVRLGANPIDVSNQPSVAVRTGETIEFHLGIWNYAAQARGANFSSLFPSRLDLLLSLAFPPSSLPAEEQQRYHFEASVASLDRSISVAVAPVRFELGYRDSETYTGPFWGLSSSVSLNPALSEQLFRQQALEPWSDAAVFRLRVTGAPVEIGIPGYPVRDTLAVSLIGSSGSGPDTVHLRVGAVPGTVYTATPEPETATLILAGFLLLAIISFFRRSAIR